MSACPHVPYDDTAMMAVPVPPADVQVEHVRCPCCGLRGWRDDDGPMVCPYCHAAAVPARVCPACGELFADPDCPACVAVLQAELAARSLPPMSIGEPM